MPPRTNAPGAITLVLDTTAIVSDWFLTSPAGSLIRGETAEGRVRLLVPDVVVAEAAGVYRRTLKAAQKALRQAINTRRRLARAAPDSALDEVELSVDLDAASSRYRDQLHEILAVAGAEIIPTPDVPHDAIVRRALAGRKPFDREGRAGYRDALIWHSVLDVARTRGAVILVSGNSSDFAQSRREPNRLADELIDDVRALREAGHPGANVALCADLTTLIQTKLPVEKRLLVELRERVQRNRAFRAAVFEQLDNAWIGSAPDLEVDPDIGVEWEDMQLDLVGDLHDFDIAFAAAAKGGAAFVRIVGHADIQLDFELGPYAAFNERGLPRFGGLDWNESTETAHHIEVLPAELTFEVLYAPGEARLRDVQLTRIAEDWGWGEQGRVLGAPPRRR